MDSPNSAQQQSSLDALRLFEEAWEETRQAFITAQDEFAEKLASARQTLRSCAGNVEKHRANIDQLTESAKARIDEVRSFVAAGGDSPSSLDFARRANPLFRLVAFSCVLFDGNEN